MHILLIHQAFAALDEPGGTRHHELARFLVQRGYRVTVITSPISYLTGMTSSSTSNVAQEEIDGITIIRAYTYDALHKSFLHRVFAFLSFMISSFFAGLRVREVDVVWGTSPPIFQGLTAWALAHIKGAAFLFEVRDLWPDFAIAVGVLKNPILIAIAFWLEHFLYSQADEMVVNSPGYIDHVKECGARSVTLVPNGADPQMFNPFNYGTKFRRANHLREKFVVMYAGAHGMSNDLNVLLDAAKLLERNNEIQIVLLGDGKEKFNLQAYAVQIGLRNVLFLPAVPKTEMATALAGSDACVAILKPIDEYKTTYPNKVFDYMAAGRPVVLAIDGVIREVVVAANCGVTPTPGDAQSLAEAIASLAANRDRAVEMGINGRRYLEENFSREGIADKLEKLIATMQ